MYGRKINGGQMIQCRIRIAIVALLGIMGNFIACSFKNNSSLPFQKSGPGAVQVSGVSYRAGKLEIQGNNLDQVTQLELQLDNTATKLNITTQTVSALVAASSQSVFAFAPGTIVNLILASAQGSTSYPLAINISSDSITTSMLQDAAVTSAKIGASAVTAEKISSGAVTSSKLAAMNASNGQILRFLGGGWTPSDLTSLTYAGTWDVSTGEAPSDHPVGGSYYIVTVAGTINPPLGGTGTDQWGVGDWAIYNSVSDEWDKIDNSSVVQSFNGRSGPVVPLANDYTWAMIDKTTALITDLSDVDTLTTPPTDGQILKWNQTAGQWQPSSDLGGGADTVTASSIVDGSIDVADLKDGAVTYSKLNLTDGDIPTAKVNGLTASLSGKQNLHANLTTLSATTNLNKVLTTNGTGGLVFTYGLKTVVDGTATNAELPTALAVKTYVDAQAGAINTSNLLDGAVTSVKIADGTIDTIDLADSAITSNKILDDAVTTNKIIDDGVTTNKILDGAVTTVKINDDAITTAKILDGTIVDTDLADDAVTNVKIVDFAITDTKIQDDAITNVKILDGAVSTEKIVDDAVTSSKILDETIGTSDLADDAVTSVKMRQSMDHITTDYEITLNENNKVMITEGNIIIGLPPVATAGSGFQITFISNDDLRVVIDPSGNETINGNTALSLQAKYSTVKLISDGNEWFIPYQQGNIVQSAACPSGFVYIKGNSALGTSDFCVMKFEARNDGASNPISSIASTPWVTINATDAASKCAAMVEAGFTGEFGLISNAEWMTIARSVESVATNWTGGIVGNGHLKRGHSDNNPANVIGISNLNDSYDGTGNNSAEGGGTGAEQSRVLITDNGDSIWDFAGNVAEWVDWDDTASSFTTGPIDCGATWAENSIASCGSLVPTDYRSSDGSFTQVHSVGMLFGAGGVGGRGASIRGGSYSDPSRAGAFYLNMDNAVTDLGGNFGFRCVYRL